VVVEPALADAHHPGMVEQAVEEAAHRVVELIGLVRVYADAGKDARIRFGELGGAAVLVHAVARADREEGLDALRLGAVECGLAVLGELVRRDVAVAVEPHPRLSCSGKV